jgi:hypothetical protein
LFEGFRSRCTIRFACAWLTASQVCRNSEPLRQRRRALLAPVGDRLAVDVFQREVGLAVLGRAGIEQARDVGVLQPREDLAFAGEAQAQVRVGEAGAQQLQCDAALVQAVVAAGHPHLAHAAFAEQALEPVRADARAGARAGRGQQRFAEEVAVAGVVVEQGLELVRGFRVFLAHQREAARARFRVQLQQGVEQGGQPLPALGIHACAGIRLP